MKRVFWLFPIVFMTHEMEEIIGFVCDFNGVEFNFGSLDNENRKSKICV